MAGEVTSSKFVVQEENNEPLSDIFSKAWNTYEKLENSNLPFNSYEFQSEVKSAVSDLETATRIVSRTGLFSPNEPIDEVTTESLQYLLLPYLLGKLVLKLQREDRVQVLEVAEVYFKDYLQRCEDYELSTPTHPKSAENENGAESRTTGSGGTGSEMANLMRAAHARNDKIAQFRMKKDLEERLKQLKPMIQNDRVDDELKREFFIKLLKKCIIEARDELESVKLEKQMAEMRKLEIRQKGGDTSVGGIQSSSPSTTSNPHSHPHHHQHDQAKRKPLQPFIITRDATQKAVFGMGYPSLPIMTVDDFYQQRVNEGVFPDAEKMAKINREKAITAARDPEEVEEEEKAALESQVEDDDPEYIDRMRRMDEYKDVVRRGDGNRHNRS